MRSIVKHLIGFIIFYSGLFHLVRLWNNILGKRLTIVTYHRVSDKDIDALDESLPYLFVSATHFESQLKFLKKHYKIINFEKLSRYAKQRNIPWNSLIITFDDGYADNYIYAYPLLRHFNLPFTIFLTVNKIGNANFKPFWWDRAYYYFKQLQRLDNADIRLDKETSVMLEEFNTNKSSLFSRLNKLETQEIEIMLDKIQDRFEFNSKNFSEANRMLNWQEVFAMTPFTEFGSHTWSHSNLVKLQENQRAYELTESKKILEDRLKKKIYSFSYPHGNANKEIGKSAKDAGYEFTVTCTPGINGLDNNYSLRRINIWEGTSRTLSRKFSKGFFAFKLLGV